jgi:hypothetical protein
MNCNCIVYNYCLVYLSKRSGAVPFMHKVVYDDYCIYWNRDALYHNFLRRTRPLSWSLELARARPLLWTKRVSQSSSGKSGNYMAQTTLQLLLVFEERGESWRCSSVSCIFLCGNVHLMNIVVGLGCKMDQHSNNIVKTVICVWQVQFSFVFVIVGNCIKKFSLYIKKDLNAWGNYNSRFPIQNR